jgi:tRNA(Ile)-lysidine synthase TilS/MesJ
MSFLSKENINKYKILRPLLSISKADIKKLCKIENVQYFEDYTNQDETISQRNFIRKNIINNLNSLKKDNLFFSSFDNIYNFLENNN